MKYKFLAGLNLTLGIFNIILPASFFLFIVPKLSTLLIASNTNPDLSQSYFISALSFLIGALSIWQSYQLLRLHSNKNLKINIILLVLNFFIAGIASQVLVLSVITPIYKLTTY